MGVSQSWNVVLLQNFEGRTGSIHKQLSYQKTEALYSNENF